MLSVVRLRACYILGECLIEFRTTLRWNIWWTTFRSLNKTMEHRFSTCASHYKFIACSLKFSLLNWLSFIHIDLFVQASVDIVIYWVFMNVSRTVRVNRASQATSIIIWEHGDLIDRFVLEFTSIVRLKTLIWTYHEYTSVRVLMRLKKSSKFFCVSCLTPIFWIERASKNFISCIIRWRWIIRWLWSIFTFAIFSLAYYAVTPLLRWRKPCLSHSVALWTKSSLWLNNCWHY